MREQFVKLLDCLRNLFRSGRGSEVMAKNHGQSLTQSHSISRRRPISVLLEHLFEWLTDRARRLFDPEVSCDRRGHISGRDAARNRLRGNAVIGEKDWDIGVIGRFAQSDDTRGCKCCLERPDRLVPYQGTAVVGVVPNRSSTSSDLHYSNSLNEIVAMNPARVLKPTTFAFPK